MRVMARSLGRFADDRILRKHMEWLLLGVCVSYEDKKTSCLAFLDVSKEYDWS